MAVPLELYKLVLLAGLTDIFSIPTGVPVTFKNIRITVSPPVSAPALPSDALLFFLILLTVVFVATPSFLAKVRVKSEASKAPDPLLAL